MPNGLRRSRWKRLHLGSLGVLACVAVVTGCGVIGADDSDSGHEILGGGDASTAPAQGAAPAASIPPIGAIPHVTSRAEIRLPLDQYDITGAQIDTLEDATNVAVHVCLRRLGFDVSMHTFSSAFGHGIADYTLEYLSATQAAMHGYRGVPTPSRNTQAGYTGGADTPSADANAAYEGKLRTVNGQAVPHGGCRVWGYRAVRSPTIADGQMDGRTLEQQMEYRVLADPRMLAAFSAWRTCMSGRGFDDGSPMDASGNRPNGGWPKQLGSAEIATATADADCRDQTNVTGTWVALMTAYENQAMPHYLTQLVASKKAFQSWLTNAAAFGG